VGSANIAAVTAPSAGSSVPKNVHIQARSAARFGAAHRSGTPEQKRRRRGAMIGAKAGLADSSWEWSRMGATFVYRVIRRM